MGSMKAFFADSPWQRGEGLAELGSSPATFQAEAQGRFAFLYSHGTIKGKTTNGSPLFRIPTAFHAKLYMIWLFPASFLDLI